MKVIEIVPDSRAHIRGGLHEEIGPATDLSNTRIHRLQVILKVAERCNLACSYCYYFFGDDQSYKERPGVMRIETVHSVAEFLKKGATELKLAVVQIVFHGGEPLLLKKGAFDEMCTVLRGAFEGHSTQLIMTLQTNGTLVDDEWVQLFIKHRVAIGTSLDGPQEYNDIYRVDHKGRGSHAKIVAGVNRIIQAYRAGAKTLGPAGLVVVKPEWDYERIFHHLVQELGFPSFAFLLPDFNHDSIPYTKEEIDLIGRRLCSIVDCWEQNGVVEVREIKDVLDFFQVRRFNGEPDAGVTYLYNQILDIQSDGTVSADDSWMPSQKMREALPRFNIRDKSLAAILSHPFFRKSWIDQSTIPAGCQDCAWKFLCRGGALENRYKASSGVDNPSVYCEALKPFYERIVLYLVRGGYPVEKIRQALQIEEPLNAAERVSQATNKSLVIANDAI
jgi:uncharacterized protein